MKTQTLAAITVVAFVAIGAHGQGAGGASGAGTSGTSTSGGVNTAPGISGIGNPGTVSPGINSGTIITPANPANPNQSGVNLPPPINPNTPVIDQGMAPNNLNLGSNNLSLGTNAFGVGSNQFAFRTNGLGTNFLTPTGPNNSRVLSNNVFVNPTAGTNVILLQP